MNTLHHKTMRTGLLGEHLSHSFSPQIHAALAGDRYSYELFERAPEGVEAFIKGDEWDAINVTIPYKQTVMPYLDTHRGGEHRDPTPRRAAQGGQHRLFRLCPHTYGLRL